MTLLRVAIRTGTSSFRCLSKFSTSASFASDKPGVSQESQFVKPSESVDIEFEDFVEHVGAAVSTSNKGLSFAKMLRNSKLMQLGDIDGRVVTAKIIHRMADDLYLDLGLKFPAVCKAPPVNGEHYTVGAHVLVRLHDYELSERFLGSKKDLTLLEADATLLRLLRSGAHRRNRDTQPKHATVSGSS